MRHEGDEIGFVLRIWGSECRRDASGTVDWVRFAFFVCWVLAFGLVGLGLFGENPEVRIQNSGEGGAPLARVLSDGGIVGTGLWLLLLLMLLCP